MQTREKSVIFINDILQEVLTYQRYSRAIILVIEGITCVIMIIVHCSHHGGVVALLHPQVGSVPEVSAEISARSFMD